MKSLSLSIVALCVAGALGSSDFDWAVQNGFQMGLFPREVSTNNLQAFTGALGGVKASAISQSGNAQRPFEVDGDTFVSGKGIREFRDVEKPRFANGSWPKCSRTTFSPPQTGLATTSTTPAPIWPTTRPATSLSHSAMRRTVSRPPAVVPA